MVAKVSTGCTYRLVHIPGTGWWIHGPTANTIGLPAGANDAWNSRLRLFADLTLRAQISVDMPRDPSPVRQPIPLGALVTLVWSACCRSRYASRMYTAVVPVLACTRTSQTRS